MCRGWRCGEGAFFVYNLIFCVHFGGTAGKIALNKFILKALTMLTGEENRGARKVRKMITSTEQAAGMVRKMMASAVQAVGATRKTGMIALFAAVLSAAGCTYQNELTDPELK